MEVSGLFLLSLSAGLLVFSGYAAAREWIARHPAEVQRALRLLLGDTYKG